MNFKLVKKWKIFVSGVCLSILAVYGCSFLPSSGLRTLQSEAKLLAGVQSARITYRRDRDSHMPLIVGMSKPHSARVDINLEPSTGYTPDDVRGAVKDILAASFWTVDSVNELTQRITLTKNLGENSSTTYSVVINTHENHVSIKFTD